MDSSGSGETSNIISAIERSMDPNSDGNFSDHLDVISLSLGGSGNPDDDMSQAIDNVVNAGVIAVVAAEMMVLLQNQLKVQELPESITVGAVDKLIS